MLAPPIFTDVHFSFDFGTGSFGTRSVLLFAAISTCLCDRNIRNNVGTQNSVTGKVLIWELSLLASDFNHATILDNSWDAVQEKLSWPKMRLKILAAHKNSQTSTQSNTFQRIQCLYELHYLSQNGVWKFFIYLTVSDFRPYKYPINIYFTQILVQQTLLRKNPCSVQLHTPGGGTWPVS